MPILLAASAFAAVPTIDEPLRSGARAADDAAVVVGIEDYAFIPDVPYARRDADAFYDFLVYTRGIPPERVTRVKSPNKEGIERALAAAAASVAGGGQLWVYYAGHGAAHPSTGERMLLGVDTMADPAGFADRAVTTERIRSLTSGVETMLVLDTCYAGVGRGGDELAAGTRFAVPASALTPTAGFTEWTAAGANQLSAPLDATQHGAFTYFAIGALRGWADGELAGQRDGTVGADEASAYVARMLRAASFAQEPEWVGATRPLSTGSERAPDFDLRELTAAVAAPAPAPPTVPPAVPPPPPIPAAPPPPLSGDARVCFKRSRRVLDGATVRLDVDAGSRALVSLMLGQEKCVDVPPGSVTVDVKVSGALVPAVRSVAVTFEAGRTSWFFVGPPSKMLSGPEIAEVNEAQYAADEFKLLR